MKNKSLITTAVCIAAIVFWGTISASAAEKKSKSAAPSASASPAASSSPAVKAPRPIPFHGMVSAVDQNGKTFTIAGKQKSRVFKITDKTVVTKGASTATIKDIAEKQEVSGSYWKNADGSLEAKTVKVGPMSGGAKATEKAEKPKASPVPSASPKKP